MTLKAFIIGYGQENMCKPFNKLFDRDLLRIFSLVFVAICTIAEAETFPVLSYKAQFYISGMPPHQTI